MFVDYFWKSYVYPTTFSKVKYQDLSELSVILPAIGLLSIQLEKYEIWSSYKDKFSHLFWSSELSSDIDFKKSQKLKCSMFDNLSEKY